MQSSTLTSLCILQAGAQNFLRSRTASLFMHFFLSLNKNLFICVKKFIEKLTMNVTTNTISTRRSHAFFVIRTDPFPQLYYQVIVRNFLLI